MGPRKFLQSKTRRARSEFLGALDGETPPVKCPPLRRSYSVALWDRKGSAKPTAYALFLKDLEGLVSRGEVWDLILVGG